MAQVSSTAQHHSTRASMLGAAGRAPSSQEGGSDSNGYASANSVDAEIVPATYLPKAGSRGWAGLTPVLALQTPEDLRLAEKALG